MTQEGRKPPVDNRALAQALLDAVGAQGWQERLNAQTLENTTTLHAVVKEYLAGV